MSDSTDGEERASGDQLLCGQRSEPVSVNRQLRGQVDTAAQSNPWIGTVSHSWLAKSCNWNGMWRNGISYPS